MKECDLIMKGGVTSGVVYPAAIVIIGKHYRLRSIGGTSAGAMAAVLAAAAEYRRQNGGGYAGFEQLKKVDEHLATKMKEMLQPSPALDPVFKIALDFLENGLGGSIGQKAKRVWKYYRLLKPFRKGVKFAAFRNGALVFGGALAGAVAFAFLPLAGAGLVAGAILYAAQVLFKIFKNVEATFEAHDYGMLPGTTQKGRDGAAIIDWLADQIDMIAGNWPDNSAPDRPLTTGDLRGADDQEKYSIDLAAITTDLTSQRPFQLPLKIPNHHYFLEKEMNAVIPPRVVRWMMTQSSGQEKQITIDGNTETIYPLPVADKFPIILSARLSMSFPGLIQAVPLWRKDKVAGKWVRCLFSDGGISSNLPVHMFDSWLPRRPTFAITLDSYDETRHGQHPADQTNVENRVHFSGEIRDVFKYRPVKIAGIFSFLKFMFYSAKDWQDRLQSNLTGFDERVATIYLDSSQGRLNLGMGRDDIKLLQSYGALAGQKIVNDFDFDENRLRRALSILPILGTNLEAVAEAMEHRPPSGDKKQLNTYTEVLAAHCSNEFSQVGGWQQKVLQKFAEKLAALGKASEIPRLEEGKLPHTDAKLSLTATPDLSMPKKPGSDLVG